MTEYQRLIHESNPKFMKDFLKVQFQMINKDKVIYFS